MKVLLLEDSEEKRKVVVELLGKFQDQNLDITVVDNFTDYLRNINSILFDLLIVDLVVPQYRNSNNAIEMTTQIMEVTRGDYKCVNFRTAAVALTGYDTTAEERIKDLNLHDITVLTYDVDVDDWKKSLEKKIVSSAPKPNFDFVIICALPKEADGFAAAGYPVSNRTLIAGLSCREIQINRKRGVIVTAPRMGLVSAAITATHAIDAFSPKYLCMSGICAGVKNRTKIYDVLISSTCHQNDSGKWSSGHFQTEVYSVPLDHGISLKVDEMISERNFAENISSNIKLSLDEFPPETNNLEFSVILAPTSSGSSVIADENMVDQIGGQQRKLMGFEMEAFAIYEAARLSTRNIKVICAKSVVDNGTPGKGDSYHRVAAILSAKVIYECIANDCLE